MSTAGEGPHPILFGHVSVTARTRLHPAYLARPDVRGSFPAVVVVPSAWGITSSLKDLVRRIARHGVVVVVPDPYWAGMPDRKATYEQAEAAFAAVSDARFLRDLADVYRYLAAPGTEWSDSGRVGLLGIGSGGRHAARSAVEHEAVRALSIVHTPVRGDRAPTLIDLLPGLNMPLLGLYGKADAVVPFADIEAARARHRRGEWVVYQDVGHDFLDDYRDGYDQAAAIDARTRIVEFFEKALAAEEVSESA